LKVNDIHITIIIRFCTSSRHYEVFIVFTSIKPANSDALHINIAGSTGRIFLPHLEKESQSPRKKIFENIIFLFFKTEKLALKNLPGTRCAWHQMGCPLSGGLKQYIQIP
jgi:hypothetical protein